MGCGASKVIDNKDSQVQQAIEDDQVKSLRHFKVLLLGAGESGKSTVVKVPAPCSVQ